jgi:hypothetical protein
MNVVEYKFWSYRQNNSGGKFHINDKVTILVVIEAPDPEYADFLFERNTGVNIDSHPYCECCGERWNNAWGEGNDQPSSRFSGDPIIKEDEYLTCWVKTGEPYVHIYYFNGNKESYIKET